MADHSFDSLSAARGLRAARIDDEQASAIVDAMKLAVANLVTADRFEAGLAELRAEFDSRSSELRPENARMLLTFAGVIIGANALVVAGVGIVLGVTIIAPGT